MTVLLVVFVLIAMLFGLGFVVDVLWVVAAVLLALWLLGFLARGAGRTWYRW